MPYAGGVRIALSSILVLVLTSACGTSRPAPRDHDASVPTDTCGSVRLTEYDATPVAYCGWDRTRAFLPAFVRDGLTAAIAEPFNGGSYGGDPGEACGECWEVDTLVGTEVVMIHDLCPIAGNPACAGAAFHLDLASEAGAALILGGVHEGSARRVPCPVTGNVHVQVDDLNPTYLRASFSNHRLPIRSVAIRGAGPGVAADNPWREVPRLGGQFAIDGDPIPLARGGDAIAVRLVSAQGELLEASIPIPLDTPDGTAIDLGVQFTDQAPAAGPSCAFTAPAEVFVDGFGGIDEVRWRWNGWGPGDYDVTSAGCQSGSCLRVDGIGAWEGMHLYYVQGFPRDDFRSLHLALRTVSGSGAVLVAPSFEGMTCTQTMVTVTSAWSTLDLDLASLCPSRPTLDGVTLQVGGAGLSLMLDDVRFVP